MTKFNTVEKVKANLTGNPAERTDKRGKNYITFGVAQNSKSGVAYADVVIYSPKAMEKAKTLQKGDFVQFYGKLQPAENKMYFKAYNFKKFNRKAKEAAAPAADAQ